NLNLDAGVLGVFHARYQGPGGETSPIGGNISPADVEGLEGDDFAVYSHYGCELRRMRRTDRWEITLPPLTAEVFTIVPIVGGIAPIGLPGMFNSAGAVTAKTFHDDVCELTLRAGGK